MRRWRRSGSRGRRCPRGKVGAGDKTPAKQLCDDLVTRAYYNGLLLLSCGVSTVRFMPPLLITRADVDEAMTILEASLAEATG